MNRRLLCLLIATAVALAVPSHALGSDDDFSSRQWALRKIGAEHAWGAGRGAGITIAIVDTGVDPTHEDLRDAIVAGYDFVDRDSSPTDEHGHGTHVAGIAAARADNEVGIAGVAPKARIMPIRVLDEEGSGYGSDIDEGVRWAVQHGADVVNLSLGADVIIENLAGGTLTDTVNYAWSNGVVPVIAAGNEGFFRTELRNANTIIVTATTPDDRRADYATDVGFAKWGIAAPGGTDDGGKSNMIFSTFWTKKDGSGYGWGMGTSMAAPHVAGAAALLRGAGLSPQQTVDRLLGSAKDLGAPGDDLTYGHGRLDVSAAVEGLPRTKPKVQASGKTEAAPAPATQREADQAPVVPRAKSSDRAASTPQPEPTNRGDATPAGATPSPGRAVAAEEGSDDGSALPNIIVGGLVLAAIGGLLALGRLRQVRGSS